MLRILQSKLIASNDFYVTIPVEEGILHYSLFSQVRVPNKA